LGKMDKKEKSKVEKLFKGTGEKERRNSIGCTEKILKKKRGEMDKSGEKEEVIFKRSNIIERSSVRKREIEGEGLEKWMKETGGKVDRIVSWMEDVKEEFRWGEGEGKNMMDKIKRIEKNMEGRKREKREGIKGMVAKGWKRREAVEEN